MAGNHQDFVSIMAPKAAQAAPDLALGGAGVASPWIIGAISHVDAVAGQVTLIGGALFITLRLGKFLLDCVRHWRGRRGPHRP